MSKRYYTASAALVLSLVLAGCSGTSDGTTPSPSPQSSPTTATEEPGFAFQEGEVDFAKFSKLAIPANQAIKTLKIDSTSVVETSDSKTSVRTEGVVDQTDPESVDFQVKVSGDEKFEVIRRDGVTWTRVQGGDWEERDTGVALITTSTSFFQELRDIPDAVVSTEYKGESKGRHEFLLNLDYDAIMGTAAESLGEGDATVWVDDDYRVLELAMTVALPQGKSSVVSKQSEFNEPVKIREIYTEN